MGQHCIILSLQFLMLSTLQFYHGSTVLLPMLHVPLLRLASPQHLFSRLLLFFGCFLLSMLFPVIICWNKYTRHPVNNMLCTMWVLQVYHHVVGNAVFMFTTNPFCTALATQHPIVVVFCKPFHMLINSYLCCHLFSLYFQVVCLFTLLHRYRKCSGRNSCTGRIA